MSTTALPDSGPMTTQADHRVTVAFNVLRLIDRPMSTSTEVGEAIEQDPNLGEQILRMARSPLCGVRTPDLTVARAIVLLGFVTIRKLVVVSLCRQLGSADAERTAQALWVGIAAEEIVRRIDEDVASEALMAGMMRNTDGADIGVDGVTVTPTTIDPDRLERFLAAAEAVADVIIRSRPGLPSMAEVDAALESAGIPAMQDGKLPVDIRRGYELYSSLLS